VGINSYQSLAGMRYCVNDATDWKSYLVRQGYTISSFLTDSRATEANIRAAITNAANQAGSDGTLMLIFSGQGTDSSPGGESVFCAHDAGQSGNAGYVTATELKDLLSGYGGRLFAFFDSSNSGGMGELATSAKRYVVAATTAAGYRHDIPPYNNGTFTYWFLEKGLVDQGFTSAEQAFSWVSTAYPYSGNDVPQQFDGDNTSSFSM
jgi:uncharacterized caspase-like protein